MEPWILEYERFEPEQEKLREALCTLGNGYFATRGAASEASAGEFHYPGTYLAGGYNRLKTEIAGEVVENEDLVNFLNWLPLSFRVETEDWFNLQKVEILDYRQQLDMRQGILRRQVRFREEEGRILFVSEERLVHQPAVRTVDSRQHPSAAPRQRLHRLQRLAILPGDPRRRVSLLLRRRDDPGDRPLLGEPRHLEGGAGAL